MNIVWIIKPDIVINNEIPKMKHLITDKLGKITYQEMFNIDILFLEEFYSEYKNEDFFLKNIVKNMTSSPVIILNIETPIEDFKKINEIKKEIRDILGKDKSRNSIHLSDSEKSVKKEKEVISKFKERIH